jgi:hypothetical protein
MVFGGENGDKKAPENKKMSTLDITACSFFVAFKLYE